MKGKQLHIKKQCFLAKETESPPLLLPGKLLSASQDFFQAGIYEASLQEVALVSWTKRELARY